ncbi:MAG: Asp-tRNA(Asn)/Glu-tRNA(Gln) amidotransferase subunit GatC [Atopostipes sp.]|nr:Asp-tRNA(Asn)/Glu-tRNA(Gln) amidotransferase subunit GatC [Atopostipes sp.]
MKVDAELVEEIGKSVKLEFSEEELSDLTSGLNETLEMIRTLDEVDTEGIEGSYHGNSGEAVFREDEPKESPEEVEAMLEQVRARKDSLIEVPAMLDDGEAGA